jgi:hypothetical protein
MIPKSDDIKPRHMEVTDALRDAVNNLLEGVPELRSVGIILDWNIGKSEFPFGMMIGREGMVRSADELFSIMEQTAKLSGFQAKSIVETLVSIDGKATELTKKVKEMKEQMKELESKKDQIINERNSDEK